MKCEVGSEKIRQNNQNLMTVLHERGAAEA